MDSNMTVLLVEDDEILAGEIRQVLEKWFGINPLGVLY